MTLLVLFDVDRTLFVSSDSLYGKALAAAVHEVYGLRLSEDAFARTENAGRPRGPASTSCSPPRASTTRRSTPGWRRWTDRLTDRYLELLVTADTSHWKPAPGAAETLEQLGREHRLALLTGNPERGAARSDTVVA